MSLLHFLNAFFSNGANWHGANGIPHRLLEHVEYSAIALAIAAAIGLPIGLLTGHTGRGGYALSAFATGARALPSFGLLVLIAVWMGQLGTTPAMIPLVALAVAPILVTTHEAVRSVDPAPVDAARGMGMTSLSVLFRVELPVALPVILGGLRSAAIQVVSTATIAAYISLGGFGRYIIDGLANQNYADVVGGAVLVAGLALVTIGVFWAVGRLVVSPGVRRGR
jgi:osmoprotectant transport system permease protein